MINRWTLDFQVESLLASMLSNPPINQVHPNYASLPNPQMLYPIAIGRRLYECEDNKEIMLYLFSDDIKEISPKSNCDYLCECYVVVGAIRRKDSVIKPFNDMRSAMSLLFGRGVSMLMRHTKLSDGVETKENVMLGAFGVRGMEIQSTRKSNDKCGVFNYEMLVKVSFTFPRFA